MPYQITCEGIVAADFQNEEKAYDYIRYALSKEDCNTVTITLTGADASQPAADPNAPAPVPAPEQAGVITTDPNVANPGPQVL